MEFLQVNGSNIVLILIVTAAVLYMYFKLHGTITGKGGCSCENGSGSRSCAPRQSKRGTLNN